MELVLRYDLLASSKTLEREYASRDEYHLIFPLSLDEAELPRERNGKARDEPTSLISGAPERDNPFARNAVTAR